MSPRATLDPGDVATERSWDDLVGQHSERVYRLAYRLCGNRADAEDLTQETFVRAFRSYGSFRPGTFEGWLHRITTNLFLDSARRRSRLRFEPVGDGLELREAPHAPAPDRVVLDRVLEGDLEAALAALRPQYRQAVLLYDVHGLTYDEIGRLLGLKPGTVRSRIHRGRAQLRVALAHRAPRTGRRRYAGLAGR